MTASRVADVVARTKTGWGASRANYMAELIAERLTGVKADSYQSKAMEWGTEREPEALALYAFMYNAEVVPAGFVPHPVIDMAGASPDGLVGDDGLIEAKCPNTATHIETLLGAPIDKKYLLQMLWQMACTQRRWCDFVSFDPRMPADLQLHRQRVHYDDERVAELARDVIEFLRELDAKVDALNKLRGLCEIPGSRNAAIHRVELIDNEVQSIELVGERT